jgi:hypothetical protein
LLDCKAFSFNRAHLYSVAAGDGRAQAPVARPQQTRGARAAARWASWRWPFRPPVLRLINMIERRASFHKPEDCAYSSQNCERVEAMLVCKESPATQTCLLTMQVGGYHSHCAAGIIKCHLTVLGRLSQLQMSSVWADWRRVDRGFVS